MTHWRRWKFLVLIKTAVRSLLLHKLRSLLAVLGLVFGVASVVVMLAVAEGAEQKSAMEIQALGIRNIYLTSSRPRKNSDGSAGPVKKSGRFGLTQADVGNLADAYPAIAQVIPIRRTPRLIRHQQRAEEIEMLGVWPNYLTGSPMQIGEGRFLVDQDIQLRRNVCVIGEGIARRFFGFQPPIGKLVSISAIGNRQDGQSFRVVGVLRGRPSIDGRSNSEDDFRREIFVPLTTDWSRFGESIPSMRGGAVVKERLQLSEILVQVDEAEQVGGTASFLRNLLSQTHPSQDYGVRVPLELLEQARRQQRIFAIVVGSIAAVSLLVGGIGIMNIMLATVSERTREIGIRRALGARRTDIILQFLFETVTLSMVGALIGLGCGLAIPSLISRVTQLPTHISFWTVMTAVGVALVVGVASGVYPARRAAKLDPVQALQHI